MAGFSLDFNNTFEGGIKDGLYEVIVNKTKEDATPSGAEYAEFDLVIRNDLDQPHQNQHIFEKNFKAKATGKYNMMIFNTIGKACQLQSGKTYGSFDELLNDYVGKPALVLVKNETSEYNGKTYENLNVKQWRQTKFPDVQHQWKQSSDNGNQGGVNMNDAPEINSDDLPF